MTLKDYMDTFNINKSQWVKDIGITRRTMYSIYNGDAEPNLRTAILIVKGTHGLVGYIDLCLSEIEHTDGDML